jgi:hypothetical protein
MVRRKARTRFCSQLQTLVAGFESYYYYYSVSKAYLKRISSVSQALIRRWQSSQPPAKSVAGERRILRSDVRGREAGGGRAAIARS